MTSLEELAEVIALEEKQAATLALSDRINQIKGLPEARLRARIFSAALMIAGGEAMTELEGLKAAAAQLRRIADRLDDKGLLS